MTPIEEATEIIKGMTRDVEFARGARAAHEVIVWTCFAGLVAIDLAWAAIGHVAVGLQVALILDISCLVSSIALDRMIVRRLMRRSLADMTKMASFGAEHGLAGVVRASEEMRTMLLGLLEKRSRG